MTMSVVTRSPTAFSADGTHGIDIQGVEADEPEPGVDDVIRKIQGDAAPKNLDLSEHRIRKKMDELTAVAKEQVMTE